MCGDDDAHDDDLMNSHKNSPQVEARPSALASDRPPKSRDSKTEAGHLYELRSPQALNIKALSAARNTHHEACYGSLLEMFPCEPLAAKHD